MDAGFDELQPEQIADERGAAAAAGAGLGAGLHGSDVGEPLFSDRVADVALGDVVARTDDRLVGQAVHPHRGGLAVGGGQDELLGPRRHRHAVFDHLDERAVCARVADQHAAEHDAPVVRQDETLVDVAYEIAKRDVARSGRASEGIAEGSHVDTHQLELRRQVSPGECLAAAREVVGDHIGHRVPGADEPPDLPAGERALADGVDVGIRGAARWIDRDAAAFADVELRLSREVVLGLDARREHDHVELEVRSVGPPKRAHASVLADDLARLGPGVHLDAEFFDAPPKRETSPFVHLQRQKSRRALDDVCLEAERGEGPGSLEPEQSSSDDGAHSSPGCPFSYGTDVFDRSIDEAPREVASSERWNERTRAGREHQLVVANRRPAFGANRLVRAVEIDDAIADVRPNSGLLEETRGHEREILG